MDCLFCRIAAKDVPASIVYEDDDILAFEDIDPQAPVHLLVIPKKHVATLNDLDEGDVNLAGRIMLVAKVLGREKGLADEGYRVVVNCNRGGGQAVFHLHAHVMGGRRFTWPPG
jgi:histidine triad (HIT) family protein